MKEIIIATLTALTLGTTQAEYTIKQPLEQAQGGSLPNGSINVKTQRQEQPPAKECFYSPPQESLWRTRLDGMTITVRLNGIVLVANGAAGAIYMESHTDSGYIYTPGNLIPPEGSFSIYDYEVCREPI
ncbi:hypothetical protein N5C93_13820 [Pseudomonas nitroreducens]|uniref:hypothetical protein n=1 Tax=Pseudomonas nitroreducens TaxID=46680 RepID=UPI0014744B41|nr:hypothetical protein [Pseudomonas nitroreducens]MDH1073912.1 hypothetical protein [Pseudomonas nitroreducens]NMZ77343.1 hypothetical protein [Pseudomonas nitroreducens]